MAIPQTIKNLARDVRNKIYGRDVRESIAKGMEESGRISEESNFRSKSTSTRQDVLENRYDVAVGAHTEDSEVLDMRVGADGTTTYKNAKNRLDDEYNQFARDKAWQFKNVEKMKSDKRVNIGDLVNTQGYYDVSDGGGAKYIIVEDNNVEGHHFEEMDNGLFARLISSKEKGYIDIRWLGAIPDLNKVSDRYQGTDVAPYIEKALNITNKNLGMRIKIIGNFYWGSEIETESDFNLFGEHITNRPLLGTDNNIDVKINSPSEIFINPDLQNAVTLIGMGSGNNNRTSKSTHFTLEKIFIHSYGKSANFLRNAAYGAPSRPSWVQDLQMTGLSYCLFFDYDVEGNTLGTHTYNFSVRGGCDIYHVKSFIKANALDYNYPGLGGLSIFDNVIEWQDEGAIQAEYLFGHNRIVNNLMEGSRENMKLILGNTTTLLQGNYFEENHGTFSISGSNPRISKLEMSKNYYLNNTSDIKISSLALSGFDEKIPLSDVSLSHVALDDERWFNGLIPSKQRNEVNIITSLNLKKVSPQTIKRNQFILRAGTQFITPDINGANSIFENYLNLPNDAPDIFSGDIIIINFYKTPGNMLSGTYNEEYKNVFNYGAYWESFYGTEKDHPYTTLIIKADEHVSQLRLLFRNFDPGLMISDVLVTILKGNQKEMALENWIGIPYKTN